MLHKLNNIRSLRALSREFSIDVLEEMLEKLRIVTEEKRTQQQLAQQQAEYQEKVNTWLELMRADGISPDELVADIQPPMAGGKSGNRARRNIVIPIILAQRKPGPAREECRSRLPRRSPGKSLDSF
jgi:DNA-binding protein H-NS